MGRLDRFEFPLPELKIDTDKIEIETSGVCDGSFFIENAGGSELEGEISSNTRNIVFSPSKFKGNKVEVSYTFVPEFYKQGDEIRTGALVVSNGGEVIIPIVIKITPPAIKTRDGQVISSLEDYHDFAKSSPILARQMFNQWDFTVWLSNMGYKHMELYEHLTTDPNKERAVDNFLVLNGLKEKSEVSISSKRISLTVSPSGTEAVTEALSFTRTGWGYVDVKLTVKSGGKWLKLNKDNLTGGDFTADNYAEIYFMVLPNELEEGFNSAYIEAETENGVIGGIYVEVSKKQNIIIEISKPSYNYEDEGFLNITNNTGNDLTVEITAKDSFVKFEAKKYFVSEFARINFQVKVYSFQMAQFSFKKQPVTKTEISVRAASADNVYRKTIELSIGGF